MRRFRHLCLIISLILYSGVFAQDAKTISKLASQAESNGEYEKAIELYTELYSKSNSDAYYNALLELYPKAEQFKTAEKVIKKRIKTYPGKAEYKVDLAYMYEKADKTKDAEKLYKAVIKDLKQNNTEIRLVANRFKSYDKTEYLIATYRRGRELLDDPFAFQFEMANAYAEKGQTKEMVDEYLTILGNNPSYIQTVQNLFARFLRPDPEGKQMEMLREQVLKRIQDNSNITIYSQLLTWLYIQDKNFEGAFIQSKALDRRLDEKGRRLYNLANLAYSNKAYDVAEKAVNYVISKGELSPYYSSSKMKLMDILKSKTLDNTEASQEEYEMLKGKYLETLDEFGKSSFTLPLMYNIAELEGFYLNRIDTAMSWYETIISLPNINTELAAKAKISLADLMIIENDIWEASLLYSQVEKAFKYDQLGEIAKLKNAKIAFYTGDFYWAQAQLNVLKGSTSKLIANDAMDLSLTITDNLGLDSIVEPLRMFARADLHHFKRDYKAANKTLDSIPKFFPMSSLKDEVLFLKYRMAYTQKQYDTAATFLEDIIRDYAFDILGDNALYELAKLYDYQFNKPDKAKELYKNLMTTYPASLFVVESRKRFRALRGDESDTPEELN